MWCGVGGVSEGARSRREACDDAVDAACFSGCGDGEVEGVGSGVEWSVQNVLGEGSCFV